MLLTARPRRRLVLPVLLAAAAAIVWLGAEQPAAQSTFRAAVDLIAVDALVLDRAGRPIEGLTPDRFDVSIDGRRRPIGSLEFIRYLSPAVVAQPVRPSAGARSFNQWPFEGPGRSFVVAVDTASFGSGETAHVVQAARRFVDRLSSSDLVGVQALPYGRYLAPTVDRAVVTAALDRIVGMQSMRSGQFHLTAAEVIDITAADGAMESLPRGTGRGAAAAPSPSPLDMNLALRDVQARECRATNDTACLAGIIAEAAGFSRQFEEEAEASLSALDRMLALLSEYPARRTVIVVSAGLPVSDRQGNWNADGGLARRVGQTAARANATVYALHVDRGYSAAYSPEARRPRQDLARDRELQQFLLDQVSATSGGTLLTSPTGSAEVAFDRLLQETSAYYLLGLAPEPRDLDGRSHELRVKVDGRGLTIRHRQFVWLPKPR